jgi:hypothetical protein
MTQQLTTTLFSISVIICLALSSCKKAEDMQYMNTAEINGIDNSLRPCQVNDPCDCPGGYFIHIDNVPDPNGSCTFCKSFKAMKLPNDFTLGSNPQFPVAVKINWKYDSLLCDSSRIIITSIAKR